MGSKIFGNFACSFSAVCLAVGLMFVTVSSASAQGGRVFPPEDPNCGVNQFLAWNGSKTICVDMSNRQFCFGGFIREDNGGYSVNNAVTGGQDCPGGVDPGTGQVDGGYIKLPLGEETCNGCVSRSPDGTCATEAMCVTYVCVGICHPNTP